MSSQADVQAHALRLLGRKDKDSPFPKRSIAKPALVRGFDPKEGECCTARRFCVDILGTPASEWNTSATKVFVNDFLTVPQHACRNRKKVQAMFRSHFKTLQRHYEKCGNRSKHSSKGKGKGKAENSDEGDRYQRKYTLFHRRHAMVSRYGVLRPHVRILERLGINGMSSDEEDEGAPFVRYRVLVKPWRSKVVTAFLRALDALHRRYRKRGDSGSKRGSPPRLRYLCDRESTSMAVPKLPINAYDDVWYEKQTGLKKDDLAARPTPYNFDIDESVIQYVPWHIPSASCMTNCYHCRAIAEFGAVKIDGLTFV
ncbi:hypothetical protein C8T65DRAFT_584444 [Cerioporus squamosus]|nr:hypothetical protein C8T65DRAFT_584444 [Cerioporus squamosus]